MSSEDVHSITTLLDNCFIVNIDQEIKSITKELLQKYQLKLPDAIISATALYLDCPLFTADTGFERIEELKLVLRN